MLQSKECSLYHVQDTVSDPGLVNMVISQLGLGSMHHPAVELGLGEGCWCGFHVVL